MRTRKLASRALPLAIVGLLLAVGPATAGDYNPVRLRAEGFLRLRTTDYTHGVTRVRPIGDRPMLFGVDYRVALAPGHVRVRFAAKGKLRQMVRLEFYF